MKKIEMRRNTVDVTVGDAFDMFIRKCRVKNLSDYSILAYEKKCAEFIDMIGRDSAVSEIDSDAIDDYILELRERDLSDITVQTLMRHVRAYVYYCQECKYIPTFKVTVPKADKKIKEVGNSRQQRAFTAQHMGV
mgnify:CR=1 FL=1